MRNNTLADALRTISTGIAQLANALDVPGEQAPVADVVRGLLEQAGVRT